MGEKIRRHGDLEVYLKAFEAAMRIFAVKPPRHRCGWSLP
jgi:hypothetical protein